MPEICISQVEFSNQESGAVIHVFGRDSEGVSHRVDVTGFSNYFYAPLKESNRISPDLSVSKEQFHSIRNEPLMKIYTKKPGDVWDIRERFTHHEADILYTIRFLIDSKLKSGMSFEHNPTHCSDVKPVDLNLPARVNIIDIECSDANGFPDSSKDPIFCITCYDSFDKHYTTFVVATLPIDQIVKENGCFNPDIHDVMIYEDEKSLLLDFCEYIKATDPDILTGWNFTQFDAPYILGRMEVLGISKENLARLRGNSTRVEIRGRQLFDLLAGYRRMHLGEKESCRLDAIALAETGRQKIRFTGRVCDLWKNDPTNLVYYNFTDVELCVAIDEKDKTVEFHRHISQYVGCPLEKTTNSMPIIDAQILRKSNGRFVLPSKASNLNGSVEGFEGATVFTPPVGLKENVVVLDLKSLYPLISMTVNASPETKDSNGELKTPAGIRFKKEPDGLVREILSEILKERDSLKAKRNTYEFGTPEYKNYDMQQDVVKIIMNSYYGVSGNPTFRLYDRDVGAAITSVGRAILEHNRKLIEDHGYQVVLGDTDSCGAKIPKSIGLEGTMVIARELEKLLNDSYPEFAKTTLNADVSYFSVKFEKLYSRFFSGGKKKRYAGLLVWKEGKSVHEVDISGYETERSDSPQITRTAMKLLLSMVLEGKDYETIRIAIRDIIRNYRAGKYSLDEIGIPGGIGKNLEDYDHPDAQVRAAMYSNQWFKTNFGKGSKPKRLYIKSVPRGYKKTDVVAFEYPDQVPEGFVVDRDLMLQKTLEQPITRILDPLGWKWSEFDPEISTLSQWGM